MSSLEEYLSERENLFEIMKKNKTEDVVQWYDANSAMYEKNWSLAGFQYHISLLESFFEYVPNKSAAILDLGAGTGNIGEMLTKEGYRTIDAVDASQKMLAVATRKKIYRTITASFIGTEKIDGLEEGAYDAAVAGALFGVGTVQYNSIPRLMTYLKKGGHLIFHVCGESMRVCPALSEESLEKMTSEWQGDHVCRLVGRREAFHINKKPASVYVLQKM